MTPPPSGTRSLSVGVVVFVVVSVVIFVVVAARMRRKVVKQFLVMAASGCGGEGVEGGICFGLCCYTCM